MALFFASVIAAQTVKTASDFYLATWSSSSSSNNSSSSSSNYENSNSISFIKTYSILALVNAATLILRGIAAASVLMHASAVLHKRLTVGVFYSPMAVIVRTSFGVMLNRWDDHNGITQRSHSPPQARFFSSLSSPSSSSSSTSSSSSSSSSPHSDSAKTSSHSMAEVSFKLCFTTAPPSTLSSHCYQHS